MKNIYLFTLIIITSILQPCLTFGQNWTEKAKKFPVARDLDLPSQYFGSAVAMDGDYAVVGANGYMISEGMVHVLFHNGNNWVHQAQLTASDAKTGNSFGVSVCISGDNIVVGSQLDDTQASNGGSAYVFTKPAGGWVSMTETAKLTPASSGNNLYFGFSVGISGDHIVIGAYNDDEKGSNAGAAYVFTKPAGGWVSTTQTAKLTASDGAAGDNFGYSVAISGDHIVAGASGDDDGGSEAGSAYVFKQPGTGWSSLTETAKLIASDAQANDLFGRAVAISGDEIVIGSSDDDPSGSAYVFTKPNPGWSSTTETAKLTMSDGSGGEAHGTSVSISGENIVIGIKNNDENGNFSGSAYVYTKPNLGWSSMTETVKLNASDGAISDYLGSSVCISGEKIIAGSPYDDDEGSASGSAYAYSKPAGNWVNANENEKISPPQFNGNINDKFGRSVAIDGNYAVVGASGYKDNLGMAYVLFYSGTQWITQAELTATDGNIGDGFGSVIDVSGDQVVVGAFRNDENGSNSGSAYVFTKPSGGWTSMTQTAKLTASDGTTNDEFGISVAISGDDIVVGAHFDDVSGSNAGSAYVFTKPGTGWVSMTQTAKITASDKAAGDEFGQAVSISENTVVVGSYKDDGKGSAYVFTKPGSGWNNMTQTAKLTASDGAEGDNFGTAIDVFGNHIVVGSTDDDDNGSNSGSAYVFTKPGAGWASMTQTAKLTASDGAASDDFGNKVGISDGFVVIGSFQDDDSGSRSGSAYIFPKPSGGWISANETTKITASDGAPDDYFGFSVAISGNFIILGSYGDDDKGSSTGSAYIFQYCTSTFSSISPTICFNNTYTSPSGKAWTVANTYLDTIPNAKGCDSIMTINLTILPELKSTMNSTVCHGGSIIVNGTTYNVNNTSGTEVFKNIGANNCDSTVTINLTFHPEIKGALARTVCFGDSIEVNGTFYNANNLTGSTTFPNIGPYNCDSTFTVYLTILPELKSVLDTTICFGESIVIDGLTFDANRLTNSDIYRDIGPYKCDSTFTVNLTILPELKGIHHKTVCFGESIVVNGTTYDANNLTGTEVFHNIGPYNCDSTVSVVLTILPELKETRNQTICFGDSIVVNGVTYDANNLTGTEMFTNIGPYFCDSTFTVNLTILPEIDVSLSTTAPTITANQAGLNYRWLDCDDNYSAIPSETDQSFMATKNGNYAVELTQGNCSDTSDCVSITGIGFHEFSGLQNAILFPNPSKGVVNIDLGGLEEVDVLVFNVHGQVIYQKQHIKGTLFQFELNGSSGVYFVELTSAKGLNRFKLVKE
jgi:hypothetical protein